MKTIFGEILRDSLSTASQLELRRGKEKGPWRIWSECFLDRQLQGRREGRRGIRRERRWRLCLWHHRKGISHAFCLRAFITLVNARQTARDLQNPSDVKALTHADYRGGHPPPSRITGCHGEHWPHMAASLVLWKIHMLLIKINIYAFGRFQVQCRPLNVTSDQTETNPSRLTVDQQRTERWRERNTWGTDMDTFYIVDSNLLAGM